MNLTQLAPSEIHIHLPVSDPAGRQGKVTALTSDADGKSVWVHIDWEDGERCGLLSQDAGFIEVNRSTPGFMKPNPFELSWEQCIEITHLLMDSKAQSALIGESTNPKVWMLDYVFDSTLREKLERRMAELSAS